MELIEGFSDLIAEEMERLLSELATALQESGYTLRQAANLADLDDQTVRNVLAGNHRPRLDVVVRLAFVLGVKVELSGSGDAQERPFRVVASEQQSSISRRSASSSSRSKKAAAKKVDSTTKKPAAAKRRGKKHGSGGTDIRWWRKQAPDQRNHRRAICA